jgi:hypothetical protein
LRDGRRDPHGDRAEAAGVERMSHARGGEEAEGEQEGGGGGGEEGESGEAGAVVPVGRGLCC